LSAVKFALAAACMAGGVAIGWLAGGSVAVVGGIAVLVAAVNGYSKSYSP